MPTQSVCGVLAVEALNPYAFSMTLDAPELARAARPGQFVHVKCGHSRLLRRPISVCDVRGDTLRLVFEVRGDGTEWLSRRAAGDRLDVMGPLGNGFDLSGGGKLLLVGGGIGLPPMLFCAKSAGGEVHAVAGFRSADRAMLLEEFSAACQTFTVTSDDGTVGIQGFADGPVRAALEREKDFTAVLACGPGPMLRSVIRAAEAFGVPCMVSMEERMACGVGACLGCAVGMADGTMKHVCKDGPVFNAKEVAWDE